MLTLTYSPLADSYYKKTA